MEKSPATYEQDLLEAFASGRGPDIYFLPDDLAFHYSDKLVVIPYQSYSLTSFKNTFASGGDVFLSDAGMLAFPMLIDPLVMYYNRSTLDSRGVVYPPKTWEELVDVIPKLTEKDNTNKILKSAVAMGHYSNVNHAKDILAALFMQSGNPIVSEQKGVLHSAIGKPGSNLSSALQFYTDFANPGKAVYSWNKSFPNSANVFSSEDLAFYFGFASELQPLVNRNPNQNLGVTAIPQPSGATQRLTRGRVTGLAIASSSKNFTTAFTAASLMATGNFASRLSVTFDIPPARRDLLKNAPDNTFSSVFFGSALYAKSFLDPSAQGTSDIFRTMIDSVLSNAARPLQAITDADAKLELLLFR